jgi:SAM-dependent methyltransferase
MPGAETFDVSADAYDRLVGRYSPQLAAALIDFAGVEPGMRALDVGCGPGALSRELVQRLGASRVSAADPSEPFVAACRARLPGAEVVLAPAEALPFGDGAFDAVLSQLVVNFMGDPQAGVREMARVARAGAIVASCVWDYAGEMTLLRAFWDAAHEVDPEGAAGTDEGIVMSWCGDGELGELWGEVGLRDVRSDALRVSAAYTGFEDLWSGFLTGVGPSGAFCRSHDTEGQAALRDACRRRLEVGDDPFELTARAWAVTATVDR